MVLQLTEGEEEPHALTPWEQADAETASARKRGRRERRVKVVSVEKVRMVLVGDLMVLRRVFWV